MTDTELTRRCTKREELQKLEEIKKYYENQIEFYNNCIKKVNKQVEKLKRRAK